MPQCKSGIQLESYMNTADQVNLTSAQLDNQGLSSIALFLPALSTFYAHYVGKQRHTAHVPAERIPPGFEHGVEGLNFLNPAAGYFQYKWTLYSAGHANLQLGSDAAEDMIRNRSDCSFVLADSGGFQIGKGVWQGDWRAASGCAKAQAKREQVLRWMDAYMDYGMGLDLPTWIPRTPGGTAATGISSYADALAATCYNYQYWMDHRSGKCRLLTVLQGENHSQADHWYEHVKQFSDHRLYPDRHFNGWAMGSQNKCDAHLVLRRLVIMAWDGLLTPGRQDWIHYLGTSKLEWAVMFSCLQRSLRRHVNPQVTISFDCASPFLATANGQVYYRNRLDTHKWSYQMRKCVDDRALSSDTRLFRDVLLSDYAGDWPEFIDSPIMQRLRMCDVCYYQPGQLNKINKLSRTSWDSFSYALLMAHNVYTHILAVQQANAQAQAGSPPRQLTRNLLGDDTYFQQLADEIFSSSSRERALQLLNDELEPRRGLCHWYRDIVGSSANGILGDRTLNTRTLGQRWFSARTDAAETTMQRDDSGLDTSALEQLESHKD